MWVKYWTKWSAGPGQSEWALLGDMPLTQAETYVRDYLIPEWDQEYEWSEHYRGIQFELSATAPEDIVQKHIKAQQEKCRAATKTLKALRAELKKVL